MNERRWKAQSPPIRLLDSALTTVAASGIIVYWMIRSAFRKPVKANDRRILVMDAGYSLAMLRKRDQLSVVTQRDLDGFFQKVWTVHPFVGASPDPTLEEGEGPPSRTVLNAVHVVIEGHVRPGAWARRLPRLGFVIGQSQLLTLLDHEIRNERIGIVQVGDPYLQGLIGLLLRRCSGGSLVVRVPGNYDAIFESVGTLAYPAVFRKRRIEKLIDHAVLSRTDLVLIANEDNKRFAIKNGARAERTHVVPYVNVLHPVHLTSPESRPPPDPNPFPDRPFVALISRLEPVKHPEDVIRALATARKHEASLGAVLVGDGSQRADLESLANEIGLQDDVAFVGSRDQEYIANLLPKAAAVLSPLTGRALVEAALSGTPIVAYEVEWQSELVIEGETGRLVPYRDAEAMGDAVVDLLRNDEEATRLGRACREKVLVEMDSSAVRERQRELFGSLLQGL